MKFGPLTCINLCYRICKEAEGGKGVVTYYDLSAGIFLHDEKVPVMQHGIDPGHREVYHLYRIFQDLAFGHIDKQAIDGKGSIQGHQGVLFDPGMLGIMFPDKFRIFPEGLSETPDNDPVIHFGQSRTIHLVESIQDNLQPGLQVRHIAIKNILHTEINIARLQLHSIAGLKELLQGGIFIQLVIPVRQTCQSELMYGFLPDVHYK